MKWENNGLKCEITPCMGGQPDILHNRPRSAVLLRRTEIIENCELKNVIRFAFLVKKRFRNQSHTLKRAFCLEVWNQVN